VSVIPTEVEESLTISAKTDVREHSRAVSTSLDMTSMSVTWCA
jgi:hypothetical protein